MGQRGGTLYFHLESKNSYLVEPPKDIFSSHDGPIKMAKIAKKKEKEVELGRHPYLINSNSIAQKISTNVGLVWTKIHVINLMTYSPRYIIYKFVFFFFGHGSCVLGSI